MTGAIVEVGAVPSPFRRSLGEWRVALSGAWIVAIPASALVPGLVFWLMRGSIRLREGPLADEPLTIPAIPLLQFS